MQAEKVQSEEEPKSERIDVFRHQKYLDREGRLFIVRLTFGMNQMGEMTQVELLNVNTEGTHDVSRAEFIDWVRSGRLRRLEGGFTLTI